MEFRKEHSFFFLLAAMLFFLFASAVIDQFQLDSEYKGTNMLFVVTLLVAVFGMQGNRRLLYLAIGLVAITLVTSVLASMDGDRIWVYSSLISFLSYLLLALVMAIRQLFVTSVISANQLVGTVCVYLLLGVIWAMLYAIIFALDQSAFAGVTADTARIDSHAWLYYSFVTLSTMGYGDIVPVSPIAKTLAYLEGIAGQFYIAILVAGLVGAFMTRRDDD